MSEMKKEARYAEDKPKSCEYCYWWDDKKRICVLGEEKCYYLLPDKPKKPARMITQVHSETILMDME